MIRVVSVSLEDLEAKLPPAAEHPLHQIVVAWLSPPTVPMEPDEAKLFGWGHGDFLTWPAAHPTRRVCS